MLVSFALVLGACGGSTTPAPGSPVLAVSRPGSCALSDGTVAATGVVTPSDDGCNTCTCGAGGWECTEMACAR